MKWDHRRRERMVLRRAALVFANSHQTREHLIEDLGVPKDRVCVTYLGVDAAANSPPTLDQRAAARRWLEVEPGRLIAAFVGALGYDKNKGFDTLLRAWKTLNENAGWDGLLVAAGGGQIAYWQRQIDAVGLSDRIVLLGHTPRVSDLLAAADVLISPTRYDAYGLAIQEALCREVPAIVSSRAAISERFSPKLNELVLRDPDDAEALAQTIQCWREHRSDYQPHVTALAADLRKQTWVTMAAEMVDRIENS